MRLRLCKQSNKSIVVGEAIRYYYLRLLIIINSPLMDEPWIKIRGKQHCVDNFR